MEQLIADGWSIATLLSKAKNSNRTMLFVNIYKEKNIYSHKDDWNNNTLEIINDAIKEFKLNK